MHFQLTVASNESFCNRESEREKLRRCMMDSTHAWIQAPRRYGKTSLVRQACSELTQQDLPIDIASVDFMLSSSVEDCCKQILKAIEQQVSKHQSSSSAFIESVSRYFQRANFKITNNKANLSFSNELPPTIEDVAHAIMGLDSWLTEKKSRVVIHLDEFQEVGHLDPSYTLEATIRHCAEKVSNITFVFSGSNRHLMEQAMANENRPLFHHCQVIQLKRISAADYSAHIQDAAQTQWGKSLSQEAIDNIFMLAKCHAYFTAALCREAFFCEKPPSASDIIRCWKEIVEYDRDTIHIELKNLTPNMLNVLKALALQPESKVGSQAFANKAKVKVGSLKDAIKRLHEADYIEKRSDEHRDNAWSIVSPSLEYFIRSRAVN
jgi:hypothetical protein